MRKTDLFSHSTQRFQVEGPTSSLEAKEMETEDELEASALDAPESSQQIPAEAEFSSANVEEEE